jgi:hypothetical protein
MVWTLDHIMWIVWYSMVYGMIWYDGDGHLPKSRENSRVGSSEVVVVRYCSELQLSSSQ